MPSVKERSAHKAVNWDTRLQQREKFTVRIRNNVREYGGGSTCLKELLANADDAKASHFTVCLDKSQYPTKQLLSVDMEDLQGPALWVCNNAKFSAKDWQNYTLSVGESAKANDSAKIGKFGLGALTAYSLTDVIQIISGDSLLILDPHGTHLQDQLPSVFGNMVNSRDEHFVDVAADSPDQLDPFLSFTKHCPSAPTFTAGQHYPGSLFRLALRTPAAAGRSEISNKSLSPDQIALTLHDFVQAAPDLLLFTRHVKSISVLSKDSKDSQCTLMHECTASMSSITSTVSGCKVQKATITCQYGSGPHRHSVWHKASHNVNSQSGDVAVLVHEGGIDLPKVLGKVYSTVALPLAHTYLPVHINGDFRLSSDRRTLWAGEGDRGQGDKNKSVLIDDIAPAYAAAIASACVTEPAPDILQYWKWPTAHSFQPRLLDFATDATVNQLVANDCKVLWAPAADLSLQASVPPDARGSGKWVAPSEACLVQPSDQLASAVIINVARRAGLHIPVVPSHILKALSFTPATTFFSPHKLRRALLAAGNIVKPDEVSEVLSYVISDGEYRGLDGLHLILLNDESVEQFKWDSSGGKQYIVFTESKSESIFNLMKVSKHKLIQGSSTWSILSRAKLGDIHLLESKYLNVMVPTMDDLGPNLPKSWQHSVCNIDSHAGHPTPEWLGKFWELMASLPGAIPESLHSFALVPIFGNQLASIQHCIQHQALSHTQLQYLPSFAASTLSSIGCICIEEPRADKVSPIVSEACQRVLTALDAASRRLGMPLPQLLSQQRLGSTDFNNARQLLADHVQSSTSTWETIRQCPIFEHSTGQMVNLGGSQRYGLLPGASWEEHMPGLGWLLPWTPVKYHTASITQQKLIQHSSMHVPPLTGFLQSELLPVIKRNNSYLTEQLLLHAIDELAGVSSDRPGSPSSLSNLDFICIDDHVHPIIRTVDSTSSLLQTIFSKPRTDGDYKLLPERYATPARLAVLKRHGLRHLSTADPKFFITCSERFTGMSSSLTRDEKRRFSRGLVDMLHSNLAAYTYWSARTWDAARAGIAACPIFKTAELQFPYNSTQPEFVALASSADHDHYQLVSLALPVTDNSHGDTQALRRRLGLRNQPGLKHVVEHLLKLTAMPELKAVLKPGSPMRQFVLEGIQKGYQFIIKEVSAWTGSQSMATLADESNKLAQGAWVLVQDCKFVRPCELCFDLEEDTSQGYEVPSMLMTLINTYPAVKRWFIDALKVTDLHDGAPSVKQLHENPVTATTSVAKYLEGDFNNPVAYPDAILSIDGQQIHVHKRVVAKACNVLARHWDPMWGSSSDPIALDTSLCCHHCNIHPSYGTALLFLEYFYTGEVMWPDKQADVQSAVELLVMACMYDVQHLVCSAEMALQCLLDTDNCCAIFAIADHHEAVQLRARCLHFIRQGHRLIKSSKQYRGLDHTLQAEVQLAVSQNT